MANNTKEGVHRGAFPLFFNRGLYLAIISFLVIFTTSFTVSGQKISKYYTAALIDSGTLYFIFPLDDFLDDVSKNRLIFDISYLSSRDSATVNFSYFLSSAHPAKALTFKAGDRVTECTPMKLFMDVENHQKWHHRFTTTIHLSDLEQFFQSVMPPEIIIATDDSLYTYRIKKHHWKKQGSIVMSILQMIGANS